MPKFFKFSLPKAGNIVADTTRLVQRIVPHVQPKKWASFDQAREDGNMLARLFFNALNYFKPGGEHTQKKDYVSTDDYLRREKMSPAQLKRLVKRLSTYTWVCYGLSTAIVIYTVYIWMNVSVLDGIICSFFALFVLAKGLQYNLFIRQVRSGNFDMTLKNFFG